MVIHVLLAVDAKQVVGCAVSIRSTIENAASTAAVRFHVLLHDVAARDRDALRRTVLASGRDARIDFHEVDLSGFSHLMRSKAVSHTTYARLLMDDIVPVDAERCIYIDCDMVVERDISEAWEYPLNGATVAAVANGNPGETLAHQARLGLARDRYFNAGFMIIDVRRWRAHAVSARAVALAAEIGDRLVLHDQDALNLALAGDWVELPREWNAGLSVSGWLHEGARAVFHYWGVPKPWHADYDGRFQSLFLRHLARTAYAGYRPWNPLGLGALLARIRRAIPYPPAVARAARGLLGRARGSRYISGRG